MKKNTTDKKFCPKCDRFHPRSNFYKNKALPDGLMGYCKEHARAMNKKFKEDNVELISRMNSIQKRARRFGLTQEQFEKMMSDQNEKCFICKVSLKTQQFNIDHDHSCCEGRYSCGKCVRGILCGNCNRGLGMFKDNLEYLKSAIKYLDQYL